MASGSSGFVQVNDTDFMGQLMQQVLTRRSCHNHARWERLTRMLRRIRFLQRTWDQLGGFLQSQWPASLHNGIRDHM